MAPLALVALLLGQGMQRSVFLPLQASTVALPVDGAAAAAGLAIGLDQRLDQILTNFDVKVAASVNLKLDSMATRLEEMLIRHIDSKLEEELRSIRKVAKRGSDAKNIETKMGEKLQSMMTAYDADLESKINSKVDEKLDVKLDRKIDQRLSRMAFAGKRGPAAGGADVAIDSPPASASLAKTGATPSSVVRTDGGGADSALDILFRAVPPSGPCKGSSAAGKVPKEWCGLSETSTCFSKWERSYIELNAARLKRALAVLRSPGCFPHGVSVAALGYFRTGSTLLFNIARLWLVLGAGNGLISGYTCRNPAVVGIGVDGEAAEKCSMVCKDHSWHAGVADNTQIILMSRRDPYHSVCSRKLMDIWCRVPNARGKAGTDWDAVNAYKKRCLSDPGMESQEAIKQCRGLMEMQAAIYLERRKLGKPVAYDMLMEDYARDPARQVRAIGRAIGICDAALNNDDLMHFFRAMASYLKTHPDQDMGITLMHDVHTAEQRVAKCSHMEDWMRSDDACRAWMDANASIAANSVLREMEGKLL